MDIFTLNKWILKLKKVMQSEDCTCTDYGLKANIERFFEQKEDLLNTFRKYSSWDEKNLWIEKQIIIRENRNEYSSRVSKIIYEKSTQILRTIHDQIEDGVNYNEYEKLNILLYNLIINMNGLYSLYSTSNNNIFLKSIFDEKGILEFENKDNIFSYVIEKINNIQRTFSDGMKISKFMSKIFSAIGVEPDKISVLVKDLNPIRNKETLRISLNPVDYFTMSWGNSWDSCYNTRDSFCGEYSKHTFGYLLDNSTAITYLTDNDDVESHIKKKRMTVSFIENEDNKPIIAMGRLYPDKVDCDTGIYEKYVKRLFNVLRKGDENIELDPLDSIEVDNFYNRTEYPEYGWVDIYKQQGEVKLFYNNLPEFEEYIEKRKIKGSYISEDELISPIDGEKYDDSWDWQNPDNYKNKYNADIDYHCNECKCEITETDKYNIVDNNLICSDCYEKIKERIHTCPICQSEILNNTLAVWGNKAICNDHNEPWKTTECASCKTKILRTDIEWHVNIPYCPDCYNNLGRCSNCNEMIRKDLLNEDGMCPDCQEKTKKCDICKKITDGIYVTKDDKIYCPKCYKSDIEENQNKERVEFLNNLNKNWYNILKNKQNNP